jgi:cell division protein FtsL
MLRFITIFVMIMLCGVSAGLYHVKYSVDHMEREGETLKSTIAQEKESIRILQAEWSTLNRPSRLQKLSERYLDLVPVQVSQIVDFEAIPVRGQEVEVPEPDGGAQSVAKASMEEPITAQTTRKDKVFAISPAAARMERR